QLKPDSYEVWYNTATVYMRLGMYSDAMKSFDRALRIKPDSGEIWYNRALILGEAMKQPADALQAIQMAVQTQTSAAPSPEVWDYQGLMQTDLERYDAALKSFQKAIEIDPNFFPAWHNMGMALDQMGRTREALDAYKRSLGINPDFDVAWYNMASAQAALKDHRNALESLANAVRLNPQIKGWARANPDFAGLADNPDFKAIVGQ
ncbi:MAG: tetratricopeptide repeat protein, partial [Planctomycetota bacterium]